MMSFVPRFAVRKKPNGARGVLFALAEQRLQREGYVNALLDAAVLQSMNPAGVVMPISVSFDQYES